MSKSLTVAKNYLDPEVEEELQNRLSHMETCLAECVRAGHGGKALRELKVALTQVVKNF